MMKTSVAIIVTVILSSCQYSPKCWGDDKNKGEIIREYDIMHCSGVTHYENSTEIIIKTKEEYENWFSSDCLTEMPVNFETESLIGYPTGAGGSETKFVRKLEIDQPNKTYNYDIIMKECGSQKKIRIDMNMVVVPKIPDDYTLNFNEVYK
ncbi:MAG: hypothetical protein WDZ35_01120 [Crocinitomicaceae bacterium]